MATDTETARTVDEGYGIQSITAMAVGALLALIGVAGFLLHPEEGLLFDLFGVNTLHNVVHLGSGLVGVYAGYTVDWADEYNKYFGLTYLAVLLLGLVTPGLMDGLLNVNSADNWLHLLLVVVLLGVGFGADDAR